jgi:hypothetical protein
MTFGMVTTSLWILTGLLVLLVVLTLTVDRVQRHSASPRRRFWISAMKFGGVVALLRVSVLWYVTYREWTGTQSLSLLPLVLLLYPEGLLLPPTWSLTATLIWLFSGLLTIGSLTITVVVGLLRAAASLLTSRTSN